MTRLRGPACVERFCFGAAARLASAVLAAWLIAMPTEAANKYALLIGISDYEFSTVRQGVIPLKYAHRDAEALRDLLSAEYQVTPMLNREARKENILAELNRLRAIVQPEDDFVLFFAGHGVRDPSNNQTYWLTFDAKLELLDDNGIRLEHLLDYVSEIRANRKLVLLDHCFSGDLGFEDLTPTNTTGTAGPRLPTPTAPTLSRGIVPDTLETRVLGRRQGMAIVAAAQAEAFESDDLEHGYFTEAIIRALQTRRADTNNDGVLTITEFVPFLESELSALAAAAGLTQAAVPIVQTSSLTGWHVATLAPATPEATQLRDQYVARLRSFHQASLMETADLLLCRQLFDDWADSVLNQTPLQPSRQNLLDVIREFLDETGFDDRTVAGSIVDEIRSRNPG